jgi:hypothetical protein
MLLVKTYVIATALLFSSAALAYNPPIETAGPLTVRIMRPALGSYGSGGFVDLSRPGVPFSVPVLLRNAGDTPLTGTVRVAVIDKWTVEPAGAVPFKVPPRDTTRLEFNVAFGSGTHNALYPVHAYAEFEHEGKKHTLHPVLILETNLPDKERPRLPVEWKPVPVPRQSVFGLWRVPVRRETAQTVNTGSEAGVAARDTWPASAIFQYGPLPSGGGEGIAMRLGKRPPSMREAVDMTAVEYPVALPSTSPLKLEFATGGEASYRVAVLPFTGGDAITVSEQSGAGKQSVDLAKFAGKEVRLRFEARGGDGEALWTEPTIVAGQPPQPPAFPPQGAAARTLGRAGTCDVRLWTGARGLLDAPLGFDCGARKLYMRGFRVRVGGDALEQPTAASELLSAAPEPTGDRVRVRHKFRNWAGSFDVLAELWVEREALRSRFWIENGPPPKPWFHLGLEAVSAGPWSEDLFRVYGGPGNVIERPQAFRLGYDGHSLATSFVGFDFANGFALVQHSEAIPDHLSVEPAERIASLVVPHPQTMNFFPVENVYAGVLKVREQDTRKASAGVPKLGGRFTFDLWFGSRYADAARDLEKAAKYGVDNALVVWHVWQRWGYDYRLPDVYPPNPENGTEQEFRGLVDTAKRSNFLFAPHDNYIDFYPDFEGFSYSSIAFRQNGQPYRAWFHHDREAQSYRSRPDSLKQYVDRNVNLIKKGFDPTAYFIDVWSSIAPYDYWTEDGRFITRDTTQKVWGEVFAHIRRTLGDNAPQMSEAGHDQLIGWLDGSDPQQLRVDADASGFTWRIRCADAERIPWADVAWHDKFIGHGAGYPGRYEGGLDPKDHGIYSDDYMATEVLSGRAPMVADAFSRDVVRKYWLLADAMRALALERIMSVEFAENDIHRQHVKWSNGAEVWANRSAKDWTVAGHVLPPYGFYVRAPKGSDVFEAAVEKIAGHTVEWSRGGGFRYVNGRGRETDFGDVVTAAGVRISRNSLTPLPDSTSLSATVKTAQGPLKIEAAKPEFRYPLK